MPSKRPQFANDEFYHVFNRGVEKRNIYMETSDYYRFIFSLYECNDKNSVIMRERIKKRKEVKKYIGETYVFYENDKRELLVEILAFCLMPNHYHLVLQQLIDGGISLFMKKLANSYTGYFNEKYDRKGIGVLFQGVFRAVHIKDDRQLSVLTNYIFTNPVELIEKDWKEKGVRDEGKAMKFLESYKWSSYLDYVGIKNFPSIIKKDFLNRFFGSSVKIEEEVKGWVSSKNKVDQEIENIKNIRIE